MGGCILDMKNNYKKGKIMKKHLMNIVGLIFSVIGYLYFVFVLDTSFVGGKTEYEHFYLAYLQLPFQIVTTTFIVLFIGSFFAKKYTKWIWIVFIIACAIMYAVNSHYYNLLPNGATVF